MFHCSRFTIERGRLSDALNAIIGLHNLVEEMLKSKINWIMINATVTAVQEKLQFELIEPGKTARTSDLVTLM